MAVVDELVTILGVQIAADAIAKLTSFSEGLSKVAQSAAGLATLVTGAALAGGAFIKSVVNEASELDTLSQTTGISTTALQEWGYAAEKSGLSAKAIQNDLVALQKTMSSPIPGQFNATLAMFGVSARNSNGQLKTTDQLLMDMADRLKGMSTQQAAQWASKLGLSNDTLQLLREGKAGVEALREEAHKLGGIIPEDSIKVATEFKKQLAQLQFVIHGLTSQIAIATLPALSRGVDIFRSFLERNREFIALGLSALMEGIVAGFDRFITYLKRAGDFFKPFTDKIREFLPEMSGAEVVIHLVTGALTALLAIFAPLIVKAAALGAAVLAVVLVFEDLFAFLNNKNSVIGLLFEEFKKGWPDLFAALSKLSDWLKGNIKPALEAVWEVVKYVGAAFADLGGAILDVLNDVAGPVSEFFSTFNERFPALSKTLEKFAGFLGSTLKGAFDLVVDSIKVVIEFIGDLLGVAGKAIEVLTKIGNFITGDADKASPKNLIQYKEDYFSALPEQLSLSASQPAVAGKSNVTNNDNKQITIHVATSDPQQAANLTAQALSGNSSVNINTPGAYAPLAN